MHTVRYGERKIIQLAKWSDGTDIIACRPPVANYCRNLIKAEEEDRFNLVCRIDHGAPATLTASRRLPVLQIVLILNASHVNIAPNSILHFSGPLTHAEGEADKMNGT